MSELYNLPDGWVWKKLGDLTTTTSGGTPKRNEKLYWGGNIGWLKSGELNDGYITNVEEYITDEGLTKSSAKLFPKGTLLIAMYGATVGKLGILEIETTTNQAICGILNDKNKFETLFMFYYLKKIREKMIEDSFGGAQPNLSQTYIKDLDIPLPPLEEQKRIVVNLDNLFAKIDKAIALHQKNIDEADIFMASVLNDVFVELEEKYGVKEINSLFKIKSGNFLPAKNMVEDGEINVYGGNGINGKHNEFNLSGENIIIGRVGALCGNVRCVNDNIWLTDNAFYISEYFEEIDKNFLAQMLIHIDLGSSANKSAQPVISYKSICEMTLPLPPLKTQQKVVSYLDEISNKMEKIKNLQKKKMQSLKELKASILDKAFKGEL